MQQITTHARNLGFPEGPVLLDNGCIAFVDLRDRNLRIFNPKTDKMEVIAEFPGSPNGLRRGNDGALYIANNGGLWPNTEGELSFADPQYSGMIHRYDLENGELTNLFSTELIDGPLRPNDLAFNTNGQLFFTDPRNWEVIPNFDAYETGRIYMVVPGEAPRIVAQLDHFCNGLAFHPTDGSLLVGQSYGNRIVRLEWDTDARQFLPATDWAILDPHMAPDGMIFEGNRLIVTGSRGDEVQYLDLSGDVVERIPLGPGSDPTNVCVAHGRVWVTLGYPGTLVSWDWETDHEEL